MTKKVIKNGKGFSKILSGMNIPQYQSLKTPHVIGNAANKNYLHMEENNDDF